MPCQYGGNCINELNGHLCLCIDGIEGNIIAIKYTIDNLKDLYIKYPSNFKKKRSSSTGKWFKLRPIYAIQFMDYTSSISFLMS